MVDAVLLLVDAVDGPMPQTRFVSQKAFAAGLKPIVVVNKVDREGARPDWVIDQIFDLFVLLGATDEQLDFPIVYCSALQGYATLDLKIPSTTMEPLLRTILEKVSPPQVELDAPFQMQISSLDYSSYVGAIGIGRIRRGRLKTNMPISVIDAEGKVRQSRVKQILGYMGLERKEIVEAQAGDIIAVTGIEEIFISDTLCDPQNVEALPALEVDEPTVCMTFQTNTSPFAGKEGQFVTSRQLKERLERELIHNVALRVEPMDEPDKFLVSGRGELHLSILIETMRREGYELAVSRPHVILKQKDGETQEPYEHLVLEIDQAHQGSVMEALGSRRAELKNMVPDSHGNLRLEYQIPSRGLFGFHTEFLTMTSGTGLMHHVFDHYGPYKGDAIASRINGVLIANGPGKSTAYALWNLEDRGRMFIDPGQEVYEGMIIGAHSRDNDLVVNAIRGKQLTNIRAAGSDENILLTPPIRFSLEQAMEFIDDDELVEVTPKTFVFAKNFSKSTSVSA